MKNPTIKNKETQLEIWCVPFNDEQRRWADIIELRQTVKNVRRGLFQRFHILQDKVMALEEELNYLREEKDKNQFKLVGNP